MTDSPRRLPCQSDKLFLTDGGLETTLVFHDGVDLPHFAAFHLLKQPGGRERLYRYFRGYGILARELGFGFVLESMTWRASADWGMLLGYKPDELAAANRAAIMLMHELREELETADSPMVISGCIGPRGDGYRADQAMTPEKSRAYHQAQVETLRDAAVDYVSALTLATSSEAIGITRAAQQAGVPVVISFTVETDGRLPNGESLREAIATVDRETDRGPAWFMVNCAHPTHFAHLFEDQPTWAQRVGGLRANASCKSHQELDASDQLDDGDPHEFGEQYRALRALLPNLCVVGGCCGTDLRHIDAVANAVTG